VLGSASTAVASTSYAVIATIPLSSVPNDGLAVVPGSHSLYVSRTDAGEVSVIDLDTNTETATIAMTGPGRIAVDPALNRAYVTSGGVLRVVDTTTNTIAGTIAGFTTPIAVAADTSNHRLYVTNYDSETVSYVDPTTSPAIVTSTDHAGSHPWAVGVDPTTHKAYASNLFEGNVTVVAGTTILGYAAASSGPIQVTVDPVTHHAYVINNNVDDVSVIDTTTDRNVGSFRAGRAPSDIAVDPGTHTLFVTNRDDNSVSVIDQATETVIGTVPVGAYPVAVRVDPSTHRIYVTNAGDSTISVIAPFASQEITFTSTAPSAATVGSSYTVSATGGGSGQPVTFSVDPSTTHNACSIVGSTVSFDHVGSCVVAAAQAGDSAYTAAPATTQVMSVGLNPTATAVSLPTDAVVFGQPATATATVTGTHAGSVQFTLDGAPLGSPVAPASDGTATSPELTGLAVGAHPVGAVFTPDDPSWYAASSAAPQTLTVSRAATTSSLSVAAGHLTTTVTATAPGAGVPSGTVQFLVAGTPVGSATLAGGTATLAHVVPAGATRQVSAVYAGDGSFTGSSASTARRDPVITAHVTSRTAVRHGWYAAPVTVTFTCAPTSAALTSPCPAPVTLSRNAAGQSVTRTVVAADGGAATAVVNHVNIDRVRPSVRITGVRASATYFAAVPHAACRATDRLSGVASCTVRRSTVGHRVTLVATATDRAGNRRSTRLTARTTAVAISGAAFRQGHFVVHRGRTYTVLVAAATRPTYVYAAPSPLRPAGGHVPFKRIGKNRWALGVTFTQAMRHHTYWNIGTRVGSHTTVTTVRVGPWERARAAR